MSALKHRAALLAAGLALFFAAAAPAFAEKLETGFSDQEVLAAFEKVLDDPFFERFSGLTVYDKAGLSKPDRRVGGTQSFHFVQTCVIKTVTETQTHRVTKTRTEIKDRYLAYIPTLELTRKPGVVKLYCEVGEFGKDPGKSVNPFAALGGILGAIGEGVSLGALGGSSWGSTACSWAPFDPYSLRWIEQKWLSWRIRHFLPGGEDKLEKAFAAFNKKKYDEALPLFEEFAAHFSYGMYKVNKAEPKYKVWPFTYSSQMPEIFAALGDIYRFHLKDMTKAEENYRIASSLSGSPYLAETAGIVRANRGLGYILAERARAAASGPDKELFAALGKDASFYLYAYLGAYKDKDAPDKPEVLKMISEVDPDEVEGREKEAERKVKMEESKKERKEEREKVKAIMEY